MTRKEFLKASVLTGCTPVHTLLLASQAGAQSGDKIVLDNGNHTLAMDRKHGRILGFRGTDAPGQEFIAGADDDPVFVIQYLDHDNEFQHVDSTSSEGVTLNEVNRDGSRFSISAVMRGRPGERRYWAPSNFSATILLYQPRMVSGLAMRATCCSSFRSLRPRRLPISASVIRSGPDSRNRDGRLGFQDAILGQQVLILQEQFLVDKTCHVASRRATVVMLASNSIVVNLGPSMRPSILAIRDRVVLAVVQKQLAILVHHKSTPVRLPIGRAMQHTFQRKAALEIAPMKS